MELKDFRLIRLSDSHTILPFDCGESEGERDLNDFLVNDAKDYLSKLLAVTYILEKDDFTAAFFCVSNDKITMHDMDSNNDWLEKIRNIMPDNKQYSSYPAVKIGRLAVHKSLQRNGIGYILLDYVKELFVANNKTGCMFITVDAYVDSLNFYSKNSFKFLCPEKEKKKAAKQNRDLRTSAMYYDLRELKD